MAFQLLLQQLQNLVRYNSRMSKLEIKRFNFSGEIPLKNLKDTLA